MCLLLGESKLKSYVLDVVRIKNYKSFLIILVLLLYRLDTSLISIFIILDTNMCQQQI